jgi:putative endonuclease
MPRTERQVTGDAAEAIVADRLTTAGWTVLGRNVRVGRCEIDLVCVDPGPPPTLVVVEVRFRQGRDFGLAEETVDRRKRHRLWAAACTLADKGRLADGTSLPRLPLRLDLVAVEPGVDVANIRHHRAVR